MKKSHSVCDISDKKNPKTSISPEEMFNINDNTLTGGIFGYRCPKIYFDYNKILWFRKRDSILNSHKRKWPPEDWKSNKETGKKSPPTKKNFIDEQILWANSFYDSKRAEKIKEELETKNRKIEPAKIRSDFDIKPNKINNRKNFLEREKQRENIKKQINSIQEWRIDAIENIKDKIKKEEEEKKNDKNNKKKFGMSFTKTDRVTVAVESEFLGEQIPFYNTAKDKNGEIPKKLFNPNKTYFLTRSPSYTFGPKKGPIKEKKTNSFIKARNELLEEKIRNALEKSGIDIKKYDIDMGKAWMMTRKHGSLPHLIRKPYDFNTEQYKTAQEKFKDYYGTPGPNLYWDDGKAKIRLRKNIDEEKAKKYQSSREKTYKRYNQPCLRKYIY